MTNTQNPKFDLMDRTEKYAIRVRSFVKQLPHTTVNFEDIKQLVRSSGSVGANYIEACDCLSKKDFGMRIKICRKEAKESQYWLKLLDIGDDEKVIRERDILLDESIQLMKIFGAIVSKLEK